MGIDANEDAPEQSGGFLQGRAFALIRVVATAAIVAGLIFKLSPGELSDTAGGADPWMLLAAAALMFVVQALVAVKWMLLLRARDVAASWPLLVRCYCVGNLLSTVLPTAVGGDVYRVYRMQREANARAADVTMSVLYERATGYGAMTCIGALGAAFHFDQPAVGLLALLGGVAAALLLALLLPRMPFPAVRNDHFVRNLLAHRRELMAVYQAAVFSVLIQALYISTIVLSGRALGIDVSWWYWAFATWVIALALLLPVTLGGLGVRESSYSALLGRVGATAAQGAAAGFALGVLVTLANAAGLLAVEAYERIAGRGERLTPRARAET